MREHLRNKEEIMEFLGCGETMFFVLIDRYFLPCQKIEGKWMSNMTALNEWSKNVAMGNIQINENQKT